MWWLYSRGRGGGIENFLNLQEIRTKTKIENKETI
jgi:hypothetical protein